MKLVQVTEENKRYYTKDFIHGFNTGAKTQYEADKKEAERRGRWEYIGGYGYQYRCSACIICAPHKTKYCPNCGAKMEAKGNGND